KKHKLYWLAQLRQLNYSVEQISPMIQVAVPTLYRWQDEPEGRAIEDMVVQDSWAALMEKHNMQRQTLLDERAATWANIDTWIRHCQHITSAEYIRALRVRRLLEQDLHR